MYRIYIGRKVVAEVESSEKAHQLERELRKTNENVYVELV